MFERASISHDGINRDFMYNILLDVSTAAPVIIALHKARSNGYDLRKTLRFRLDELAAKRKFIVVYPDGYGGNWNDCRKAPRDSAHLKNIDDLGFIINVIDYLRERQNIDLSRIFVFGVSNGGHMALRLAGEIPEKIKAIAPLLTQIPTDDNWKGSAIKSPISAMFLNATKDPISPFLGGEVSILRLIRQGRVKSVSGTIDYWLSLNRISSEPQSELLSGNHTWGIERKVWKNPGSTEVRQLIVYGAGHTLPGTRHLSRFVFGETYDNYSAVDEVVEFFLNQ